MPNTYELVLNLHDFAGNFFANTFFYSLSEAGSASAWEYAKALGDKWFASTTLTDYLLLLGTDVQLDFLTAKRVSGLGGPSYSLVINAFGTGPQAGVTTAFAADIQWQSAAATNRPGHTYIGGVYAGACGSGTWDQIVFAPACNTWITAMLNTMTLTGGLGTADFGHYTRKGKIFDKNTHGVLRPKVTALNKRTKPVI